MHTHFDKSVRHSHIFMACIIAGLLSQPLLAQDEEQKDSPEQKYLPKDVPPHVERANSLTRTSDYVYKWIKFPTLKGLPLPSSKITTVAAKKDRVTVAVFLSTSCPTCQELLPILFELQKKYRRLFTSFQYVFMNDTTSDAEDFMKDFGIRSAMRISEEMRFKFHVMKLPTIYVSDRKGWIVTRYVNAKRRDIEDLKDLLRLLTAF